MSDSFNLKALISVYDKASPSLKAIGVAAQGTKKYLLDIAHATGGVLGKAGLPTGLLAGIAAGFSVHAIKEAVHGYAEVGDQLNALKDKTGIAVEELQVMQYVAKQLNVDSETLTSSIFKLNKNIGEAAAGKNKDLAALFKAMGVAMTDANGKVRTGIPLFAEIADVFERNKDNHGILERMGIAIFGKQVQALMPMLIKGSAGIKEFSERYAKLKSPMDQEAVDKAEELAKAFVDLDIVTKGFQATIAKNLVPLILPMIEEFTQWAAVNRQVIASEIGKFVKELAAIVKAVDWTAMVKGLSAVAQGVRELIDWVGGAKNVLIGLTLFIGLEVLKSLGELALAFWRTGAAALAFAVRTIPKVAPALVPLTAGLRGAALAAGGLLMALGKLVLVGALAYEATKWVSEKTGFRDWISDKIAGWTGLEDQQNKMVQGDRPSLVRPGDKAKVEGTIKIELAGAPKGTSIMFEQRKGDIKLEPNVGFNSHALGWNN